MKIFARTIHVCLLAITIPLIHAQDDKTPREEKTPVKGEVKSVDLCAMAMEVKLSRDEAVKRNLGWMEMKVEDQTKTMTTKAMPGHTDVKISEKAKQKVRFFCGTKGKVRIDSFERATAPGCGTVIDTTAPNPPFAHAFPTVPASQVILGPPQPDSHKQGCYKFSFTVWNPGATHVDPHLIIDP
jgi:hypothetical protein